ncbi:hypothetical protein ACWF7H_24425, partial [Peribacillus butanolivorans]
MNDNEFFKKMVRYIPGRLTIGILNFLPIILLTKLLEPEQYGQYKIVFIACTFIMIFSTSWISQAIIRFWHSFIDKKILYTTATLATLIINIVTFS